MIWNSDLIEAMELENPLGQARQIIHGAENIKERREAQRSARQRRLSGKIRREL
jgi:hypothetical protein